jgi:1-deoxy-D-xylulose-5-phosphate synthase
VKGGRGRSIDDVALLDDVHGPADLAQLSAAEVASLAGEIRDFLVEKVSRTGGHLGPNLGAVELTALHRVFNSPHDRIIFDTGHQAYVHKMLTGRQAAFDTLRQRGGLSGYPSRAESEHDVIENSHASTALSYADGLAKAYALRGEQRSVVAVVGDGALTGGMCWEALNNIAAGKDRSVVVVVNDNGRSYDLTIGGLADHLAKLRVSQGYESVLGAVKSTLGRTPVVGPPLYDALHGVKKGIKDLVAPQVMFEDLGLKYVGPVDGHDVLALESALARARDFGGPVIVHAVTRKGFGYRPAEDDEADCLHSPGGAFDPLTGIMPAKTGRQWTGVLGEELLQLAKDDPSVVAITAAMLGPVGLSAMQQAFPDRVFDVGIAEQHAITSAAGLAMGGLKPVVCLYATFLNRAFDQLLMDVALHRLPVTVVLDRAGVTGPDGASHHGMWDLAYLQLVPGAMVAAPRDATRLAEQLRACVARAEGPNVLRFPRGGVGADIPAVDRVGGVDILRRGSDVLVVAVGAMATTALDVADRAAAQGISVTVVDPRFVLPLDPAITELARRHRLVVTIEDGVRVGGVGARVAQTLADADVAVPVRTFGLPAAFLDHGTREEILASCGLTGQAIARAVTEVITAGEPAESHSTTQQA